MNRSEHDYDVEYELLKCLRHILNHGVSASCPFCESEANSR